MRLLGISSCQTFGVIRSALFDLGIPSFEEAIWISFRLQVTGEMTPTNGGAFENFSTNDYGFCRNLRGNMPQRCNHRLYVAWRYCRPDPDSRREGIRMVLDLPRDGGKCLWTAGVVDSTHTEGRRRCLTLPSTRMSRMRPSAAPRKPVSVIR